MKLLGRQFFYNEEKETFKKGVDSSLSREQSNKVHLLRLSSKCNNGVTIIESIWGRKNRPPMGVFKRSISLPLPNNTDNFKYADWLELGQMIGEDMRHWIDNDEEFDTSERKAWSAQFNVWDTSEYWDVTQDLIDQLIFKESAHLGALHWRVRATLTNMVIALITEVRQQSINSLSEKENLDLLEEIIQKSGLITQLTPKSKAPKATKYVKGAAAHGNS